MNNLTGNHGAAGGLGGGGATAGGGHGGDFMDKGVNAGLNKSGHGNQKPATVEKISDGIKTGIKKMTGKDVPGGDKEFH